MENLETAEITEFWTAVFGSSWETWSWWKVENWWKGAWDTPGTVLLGIDDPNSDSDLVYRVIRPADLVAAYKQAKADGFFPEGKDDSHFDFDAITGDVILQYAMFGTTVYS
jgi:hypothetical protein